MKKKSFMFMLMLAVAGLMSVPAVNAASESTEKKPSKTTLKRFDKDKDGMLNAEEEAAWNAAKEKEKERRAAKRAAKKQAQPETAAAAEK